MVSKVDESGFIKRLDKNFTKSCIAIKSCPVYPSFRDIIQGNHVSIVSGVALGGFALRPLLLSTTENLQHEVLISPLGNACLQKILLKKIIKNE